jgi:UDP-2,4-diacetamido-2,4,6-trideoxy-beta-L-altropyranose hydrolase
MMQGPLVIRVDAGAAMGTGHVMRCLALAQGWRLAGGDAVFVIADSTPAISRRLDDEGFSIATLQCCPGCDQDARALVSIAAELHATWVAVDGYQFNSVYQRRIKEGGFKLLWIDDLGQCAPHFADLILNQNLYATVDLYSESSEETSLLLGSEYVLLRREFRGWSNWRRDFKEVAKRILVTMGGGDSQNATAQILRALADAGVAIEIEAVVGGSNPHEETIRQMACELPCNISIKSNVANMPELMAGADLALSAAGVTSYELALMQVPMILVTVAENQVGTAKSFGERGAALNLGRFQGSHPDRVVEAVNSLIQDRERRRSLSNKARSFVDGCGSRRVCQALLQKTEIEESRSESVYT